MKKPQTILEISKRIKLEEIVLKDHREVLEKAFKTNKNQLMSIRRELVALSEGRITAFKECKYLLEVMK